MSYRSLGQAVPESSALPPDVSPTLVHELVPIVRRRGWVAIPTPDMREYVKAQLLTAAAGFVVGMSVGAALGNVIGGNRVQRVVERVVPNRRRARRRSRR